MPCRIILCALLVFSLSCSHHSAPSGGGDLLWSDEFDYTGAPDTLKWNYEAGYLRNNEMQYYTSRRQNVRVEDGTLIIEARRDSLMEDNKIVTLTSASVTTKQKHAFTYGRFEIRAKIPSAVGTWPAIWMLGNSIDQKDWPDCGEIDIMENVGFDPDQIHHNIHTRTYNHILHTQKGKASSFPRLSDDYHVYAIDWTARKIDFLTDGKVYFTYKNDDRGEDSWPFDKPFFLIINLAIGGAWGGRQGVDLQALPLRFYIDYVRVYQPRE